MTSSWDEKFTFFFAGLTLLATLAIAFLAVRLSSDFTAVRDKIREIEERLNRTDQQEERFRFQSQMLLDVSNDFYKTNTLLLVYFRRMKEILDVVLAGNTETKELYDILLLEMDSRVHDAHENIDYLKVLVDLDEGHLTNLVDKRPSKNTLMFLKNLSRVAPTDLKSRIEEEAESLLSRIIGYDSGKWTGR